MVEIVLGLLGRPYWLIPHPTWSSWLGDQSFSGGVVRAVLIGMVIVGLLLLSGGWALFIDWLRDFAISDTTLPI